MFGKQMSKKTKRIMIISLVFLLLLLTPLILQVIEKVRLTGNVMSFVDNDTLEFESTTQYVLIPSVKGEIKSIKISGKVIGDGSAKIMLGDKLIFDNSLEDSEFLSLTGNVVEGNETNDTETNTTETDTTDDTNQTDVNVTVNDTTETTNQTDVNVTVNATATNTTETTNTTVELNTTNETDTTDDTTQDDSSTEDEEDEEEETEEETVVEETIEAPEILNPIIEVPESPSQEEVISEPENTINEDTQKEFTKRCKDTCELEDIVPSEEYVLEIIVENARIIIYEIEYEIVPIE